MKEKIKYFIDKRIVKNIPNTLTLSRIIASIAGALMFITGNFQIATGLYIYGAVSDFFDGLAARKLNAFSEFGRKLDAFSDKIYAGSLLIPSILCGNLLMLIPLLLELRISHITLKSAKMGFKPTTQRIGKFKTVLLFPTMIVGLLSTISMDFAPLLWLLVPLTTVLQTKSFTAYENLFKCNINQRDVIKYEDEKVSLSENTYEDVNEEVREFTEEEAKKNKYYYGKPSDLIEELVFYVTSPYYKVDYDYDNVNEINDVKRRRLKR